MYAGRKIEQEEEKYKAVPTSEFYATIKGPNYDNVWMTHEGFGDDLAYQI